MGNATNAATNLSLLRRIVKEHFIKKYKQKQTIFLFLTTKLLKILIYSYYNTLYDVIATIATYLMLIYIQIT